MGIRKAPRAGGTELDQGAFSALGLAGVTDPAAVTDDLMMEVDPVLPREQTAEIGLHLLGRGRLR